jgi:signal transduction histidine kinase
MASLISLYLLLYAASMAGPIERLETLLPAAILPLVGRVQQHFVTIPTVWLLLAFPDGRFRPSWARWLAGSTLLWIPFAVAAPPDWWSNLGSVWFYLGGLFWLATMGTAIWSQLYRYRRLSIRAEQRQTKWVVYGFTLWIGSVALLSIPHTLFHNLAPDQPAPWWYLASAGLWNLSLLIVPLTLTFAVLRNHLWDIDLIINRTLVYGSLTALITAAYFLTVGVLGLTAVRGPAEQAVRLMAAFIAFALAALAWRPLQSKLQQVADRLVPAPATSPAIRREPRTEIRYGGREKPTVSRFRGRALLALWSLTAFAFLAVYTADLVVSYPLLAAPCAGPECHYQAITVSETDALAGWGLSVPAYAFYMLGISVVPVLLFTVLAIVMVVRLYPQPRGFLFSIMLIMMPVVAITNFDVVAAALPRLAIPLQLLVALGQLLLMSFFLVFPRSRFEPGWAFILLIIAAIIGVSSMFYDWFASGWVLGPFSLLLLLVAAIGAHRYRRLFSQVERQQTKWVLLGMLVFFTGVPVWTYTFESASPAPGEARLLTTLGGWTLCLLLCLPLPVSIFVAILRHNLWDIDVIIRRTAIYGLLTALLAAVYYSAVVVLQRLLAITTGRHEPIAIFIATLLIAALFQPLRERLQRGANRLLFGERDDPYAVLSTMGRRLQETAVPGETLPAIAETICQALKLPYAAILLQAAEGERSIAAASGKPAASLAEWPLRYQGDIAGWLVVAPRSPGEAFTGREQRLLGDIASHAGVAAYAARLTADLQHSRETLVLAREEERRRIRRDLHDGLGPALASQTFALDAALELLEQDPAAAAPLLQSLKAQNQSLVADIRRLVYELRPPALDELGLAQALAVHVQQLNNHHATRLALDVAPEAVASLPAAVEVAAYRLVQEAVNNVLRHAGAAACHVTIHGDGDRLIVTVGDDGRGIAAGTSPGVGMASMRERVEELGGMLAVAPRQPQGTILTALFPLAGSERAERPAT